MRTFLYRLTGWRLFRPRRAPWGESTDLWSEIDWDWFHREGMRNHPHPPPKSRPF
jgi:hypothetical protein